MAQNQLQSRTEALYSKKVSQKNSEKSFPLQEEAIDFILDRHITLIKHSYSIGDRINGFLVGFQNELINDVLLDSHENRFESDINRIDLFIERTHVKLHQLRSRIFVHFPLVVVLDLGEVVFAFSSLGSLRLLFHRLHLTAR